MPRHNRNDFDAAVRWLDEMIPGLGHDVIDAGRLWPQLLDHYRRRPGHVGIPGDLDREALERWRREGHVPRVMGVYEPGDLPVLLEVLASLAEMLRVVNRFRAAVVALRRRLPALAEQAPTSCLACGSTAGPFRHGLDEKCRKRWERADKPPIGAWVGGRVPSLAPVVPLHTPSPGMIEVRAA